MSDHLTRIERYLQNEMSSDERIQFENDVLSDAQLQSELNRVRLIEASLDWAIEKDLRDHLNSFRKESESELKLNSNQVSEQKMSRPRTIQLYKRMAIAAGFLLLFFSGLWYFKYSSSGNLDRFVADHYLAYDYTQLRGDQPITPQFPFEISIQHPAASKDSLFHWVQINPNNDEARFILADLLKQLHDPTQAKEQLASIISHSSILWRDKAEWNYVLLSVPDHMDDRSKLIFEMMKSDPSHSYHDQALQLAKYMK